MTNHQMQSNGGKARQAMLTAKQRTALGKLAARARWSKNKSAEKSAKRK